MNEPPSLVALLARVRQGDALAVHEFYRHTEPFLRGVARRLLNPALRRHVDSVDVTQSVFRRVLGGSMTSRFENETRVLAWLATIVRNRIRTLSRRLDAPGHARWEELLEASAPAARTMDPAQWASDVEEVQRFRAAMERLPSQEQEAIALHDFEGLPFAEVALLLGRPSAEAARKLHDRALGRLRRALGPQERGEGS